MAELDRLSADDIEPLAIGAGILGTGGGGNVYVAKLWIRRLLAERGPVPVLALDDLADDGMFVACGGIGAPTVSFEKLRRGDEELRAVRALETHMGVRFAGVVSDEIGGANALRPIAVAAQAGIPLIDADGMGRAFPELQMVTFLIYGVLPTPAAMADDKGNVAIFAEPMSAIELERRARARCLEMGGTAGFAEPAMRGVDLRRTAIPGSLSLALRIGRAVLDARDAKADPLAAVLAVTGGRVLLKGKIVDVERRTAQGFARGSVRVAGLGPDDGRTMDVRFQNEDLVADLDGALVVTVPDLICILDADSSEPIGTELLRYGQRVAVLGLPAHPLLRTPEALAVVGPRAFGYDVDYVPIG